MNLTLLNVDTGGLPLSFWLGVILTLLIGLLGFLLRDAYIRMGDRVTKNEEKIEELTANQEKESRSFDNKINELHLTILGKLDDIKKMFNGLRQ